MGQNLLAQEAEELAVAIREFIGTFGSRFHFKWRISKTDYGLFVRALKRQEEENVDDTDEETNLRDDDHLDNDDSFDRHNPDDDGINEVDELEEDDSNSAIPS